MRPIPTGGVNLALEAVSQGIDSGARGQRLAADVSQQRGREYLEGALELRKQGLPQVPRGEGRMDQQKWLAVTSAVR